MKISELYTATPVFIQFTCINGRRPGPAVFVTAAIHGDEFNGIESIRQLSNMIDPSKLSGTVVLVPIANPVGFIIQSRLLPDGRDLNRSFPGRRSGSMASQIAYELFNKVIAKCDYGIDLHTAGHGRTNLPHVRADLGKQNVRNLAFNFGSEIIIDTSAQKGTLRSTATKRGIPTIVFESGQPMKFEKVCIEKGIAGIKNVLSNLKMYSFQRTSPKYQVVIKDHKWVRSRHGGILILNVKSGDLVKKGQIIGYTTKPFGNRVHNITAPFIGLVISTTTIPTTIPGGAICHISKLDASKYRILRQIG